MKGQLRHRKYPCDIYTVEYTTVLLCSDHVLFSSWTISLVHLLTIFQIHEIPHKRMHVEGYFLT